LKFPKIFQWMGVNGGGYVIFKPKMHGYWILNTIMFFMKILLINENIYFSENENLISINKLKHIIGVVVKVSMSRI